MIYNGYAEGSATPPGWYGWLHHTVDVAPPDDNYKPREWQLPHEPNHDRHAARLAAAGLDTAPRRAAAGDGRLRSLDALKTALKAGSGPLFLCSVFNELKSVAPAKLR